MPALLTIVAWFDRLLDEGHLERVTVDAGAVLPGEGRPVQVSPGAPVLVLDQGGRGYLVRAPMSAGIKLAPAKERLSSWPRRRPRPSARSSVALQRPYGWMLEG